MISQADQQAAIAIINNPHLGTRILCDRSFHRFLVEFWPTICHHKLIHNWHIEYLCNELQQIAERVGMMETRKHDLVINIPPGTTKTTICNVMFPVWCWTKWHWMKFLTFGYNFDVSKEASDYSLKVIQSGLFQLIYPDLVLRIDKKGVTNYEMTKMHVEENGEQYHISIGGNRVASSVGGTATGFHGDILIVDDPLNPKQAHSERELQTTNDWLDQTLPTRKTHKAITATILIMQRLVQGDPTDYLLNKKVATRHICLPGEINNPGYRKLVNPPELANMYIDGLLDPIRMPVDVLLDLEERLGQLTYAAQIGQNPVPPSGGMFQPDRMPLIEHPPARETIAKIIRYWDKAATEQSKTNPDPAWTVGVKMCRLVNNRYVLLDVKRGRWSSEVREALIRSTAESDGQDVEVWVEQEPGSGGKESAESTIKSLAGFRVFAHRPTGDKATRADTFSVQVNRGNVSVLRGDWNSEYINELRFFPNSKYKDQTDGSSGAFGRLAHLRQAGLFLGRRAR